MTHRTKSARHPERFNLDDILTGSDEFGLLKDVKARAPRHVPHWVTRFIELNDYLDGVINEEAPTHPFMMRRKAAFILNEANHEALRPYDRHQLLPAAPSESESATPPASLRPSDDASALAAIENVSSLDDILSGDAFGLLSGGDDSIFDIKHVPLVEDESRAVPDEIAQRRVCQNFYEYESLFRATHEQIRSGALTPVRYKQSSQMREGDLFILEGVLCLIDHIGEYRVDSEGRYDPRLRVIFDNGTESNLLFQSLAKNLYSDKTGRRIISEASSVENAFNNVTHRDARTGFIYIVRSLSTNPTLRNVPNLLKIGYTEREIKDRIKNAARDVAFLEAPVELIASLECHNINPSKLETLVHGVLHAQRLSMTLIGKDGKAYRPREWFSVPLKTAVEVIERIVDGSIVNYRIDSTIGELVKKK